MGGLLRGRPTGGGAGLRDDGFQLFALAGRRLTANSSLLRSQGPVTVVKHTPSSRSGTAAFPPAHQPLKSESHSPIPAARLNLPERGIKARAGRSRSSS